MSRYGECECGYPLAPVWFMEKEYREGHPTGRERKAASHLICESCGTQYTVDDTFDGPWRYLQC